MTEIRYAHSGDTSIVYREFEGVGERDLVVITGATMPMEAWIDDRVGRRFLDGLRRLGRVVVFDRRGIGLSDPFGADTEMLRSTWGQDLEAVIDAARMPKPTVVALNMVDPAVLLAAKAPGRLDRLIAYEPNVPWCTVGSDGRLDQAVAARGLRELDDDVDIVGLTCPSRADEPGFRDWFEQAGRIGASRGLARRMYALPSAEEQAALEAAYGSLDVPTLVLRRRRASLLLDEVVELLFPEALQTDLPGRDNLFIGEQVDALLAEISRFVTGEVQLPDPTRTVLAILFTDLVDSTRRAGAMGDDRWRSLLTVHDERVRRIVEHDGGRVVKSTGDGVVGLLPSATSALRRREADPTCAPRSRSRCAHRRPRGRRRRAGRRRVGTGRQHRGSSHGARGGRRDPRVRIDRARRDRRRPGVHASRACPVERATRGLGGVRGRLTRRCVGSPTLLLPAKNVVAMRPGAHL